MSWHHCPDDHYAQGYYQECSILDYEPILSFVPEHERKQGDKVFWLVPRFDVWWGNTRSMHTWTTSRRSTVFVATPMPIRMITEPISFRLDMRRTMESREIGPIALPMPATWSKGEKHPRGSKEKSELYTPDGSCELFKALCGNKPLIFLMTVFPKYGKSRIEIAFVFPD